MIFQNFFYVLGYAIRRVPAHKRVRPEKRAVTTAYTGPMLWNRGFWVTGFQKMEKVKLEKLIDFVSWLWYTECVIK